MHSSTFSSEGEIPPPAQRRPISARSGIVVLCAGLLAILVVLELSSPLILNRFSRIDRRIESETSAARSLKPFTPDGRPTVLLVGNSLLLEGVQLDALQNNLAPQFAVSRLAVEQTHYLDWYFGLRRLLEQGSRPSVILVT